MAEKRHLAKAPIAEALVDLRAAPTIDLASAEVLTRLKTQVGLRFPKVQQQRAFEAQVEFRPGQGPVSGGTDKGLRGYFCESADGRDIAQFKVDGFTYNRLQPYTDGDTVIAAALGLWAVYVEIAKPLTVGRVALRYINRLKLPRSPDELGEYMTHPPVPPSGSLSSLDGFWTRYVTSDPQSGRGVIAAQVLEPGMPPDSLSLIIDIDAFWVGDFAVEPDDLKERLMTLRQLKNDVFFGSITEKTAEMYA